MRLWLGAALIVGIFATVIVVSRMRRPSFAAPACPEGKREDAARTMRIRALVATLPDGEARLRVSTSALFCFGEMDVPATLPDARFVLDAQASDAEAAARVFHLLTHHMGAFPPVDGFDRTRACAAQVDVALDAEARALVRELADRERLHVDAPRLAFAFTDAVKRAPDEATAIRIVRDFIDAHPNGGGGIDALATGYMTQCSDAQAAR